jgi:hypothetical protein
VKFLCLRCDRAMTFAERQLPGDGTFAAVFACESCGHEIAMLANPMETQLVSGLGIRIGGRTVPEQPFEFTRTGLADTRADAFADPAPEPAAPLAGAMEPGSAAPQPAAAGGRVRWSDAAAERLERVPAFVRGMVKRIYADYARGQGIDVITPEIMDRARSDLGLEGM